jgi:hypothetical protein
MVEQMELDTCSPLTQLAVLQLPALQVLQIDFPMSSANKWSNLGYKLSPLIGLELELADASEDWMSDVAEQLGVDAEEGEDEDAALEELDIAEPSAMILRSAAFQNILQRVNFKGKLIRVVDEVWDEIIGGVKDGISPDLESDFVHGYQRYVNQRNATMVRKARQREKRMVHFMSNYPKDVRSEMSRASKQCVATRGRYVYPDSMEWMCAFPTLTSLTATGRLIGLPGCIGTSLPQLIDLDVRGNSFGRGPSNIDPMPQELSGLKNLRSFIGFHQSWRACPLRSDSKWNDKEALPYPGSQSEAGDCKPLIELVVDGQLGPVWQCRSQGWREDMGDLNRPWYHWPKLQRFWVDGNFFYGELPYDIVHLWPEMRSIDVYGNELTSVSWEAFSELPLLEEIRLQGNYIENAFNATFLDPDVTPRLQEVHLQLNPNLHGCIPSSYVLGDRERQMVENGEGSVHLSGRRARLLLTANSGLKVQQVCS